MASKNGYATQVVDLGGAGNLETIGPVDLVDRDTFCKSARVFVEAWRIVSLSRIAQALDGVEGLPANLAYLPHRGFSGGIGIVAALPPGLVLHIGWRGER